MLPQESKKIKRGLVHPPRFFPFIQVQQTDWMPTSSNQEHDDCAFFARFPLHREPVRAKEGNKSILSLKAFSRQNKERDHRVCKEMILPGYSIEAFLAQGKNWQEDTRQSYRRALCDLQRYLAACGARPDPDTLQGWQQTMRRQGYRQRSVNIRVSAANSYFRWCGRPDLVMHHAQVEKTQTPELTRGEYLRLLRTARAQGQYRLYLLVKLFGTTDLPLQCLGQVTADLVRSGGGRLHCHGEDVDLHLPHGLQAELLAYMEQNGVADGPVFVTRNGRVINRSNVCRTMQELCQAAGVPQEKGNPRALRNLCQSTRQGIYAQVEQLARHAYEQMLETEQEAIGWSGACD